MPVRSARQKLPFSRTRDPDIAERYKRGKAKAIAHVARGLLQRARDGDTVSSIFYLKTQAGWRETDRLTRRYGPSPTEFVLLPLVSAFFVDIVNVGAISLFLRL